MIFAIGVLGRNAMPFELDAENYYISSSTDSKHGTTLTVLIFIDPILPITSNV